MVSPQLVAKRVGLIWEQPMKRGSSGNNASGHRGASFAYSDVLCFLCRIWQAQVVSAILAHNPCLEYCHCTENQSGIKRSGPLETCLTRKGAGAGRVLETKTLRLTRTGTS